MPEIFPAAGAASRSLLQKQKHYTGFFYYENEGI